MSDVIRAIYKSFYWKQVNFDTVLSSFFLLLKKNSLICTSNVKYHLVMWIKLLTHCFTKGELKWMRSYIYIQREIDIDIYGVVFFLPNHWKWRDRKAFDYSLALFYSWAINIAMYSWSPIIEQCLNPKGSPEYNLFASIFRSCKIYLNTNICKV